MSLRTASVFLHTLSGRYPPPAGRHHALTIADDGRLLLMLHIGDTWQSFTIDEADLDRAPVDVLDDIDRLLGRSR